MPPVRAGSALLTFATLSYCVSAAGVLLFIQLGHGAPTFLSAAMGMLAVAGPPSLAWSAYAGLRVARALELSGAREGESGHALQTPTALSVPTSAVIQPQPQTQGEAGWGKRGASQEPADAEALATPETAARLLADRLGAFASELLEPQLLMDVARLDAAFKEGDLAVHARDAIQGFRLFGVDLDAESPISGLVFEDRATAVALLARWRADFPGADAALSAGPTRDAYRLIDTLLSRINASLA